MDFDTLTKALAVATVSLTYYHHGFNSAALLVATTSLVYMALRAYEKNRNALHG